MILYLDKNQIRNLAAGRAVYERGESYFAEERVGEVFVNEAKVKGADVYLAKVKVAGNAKAYSVEIIFDKNGLLQKYKCDCPAFASSTGGCKHIVAAMLKIFEKNREIAMRGRIQRSAALLLDDLEHAAMETDPFADYFFEKTGEVHITPTIVVKGEDSFALMMSIGRAKSYIIKSMHDFALDMHTGAQRVYGKSLELVHKKSSFDPRSAELAELARSEQMLFESFAKDKVESRLLHLSQRGIDRFFDIMKGESVEALTPFAPESAVILTEDAPNIKIDAKKGVSSIEMVLTSGSFFTIAGEAHRYILTISGFHRVSDKMASVVFPLKKAFHLFPVLVFDKSEYGRLSAFLLPELKKAGIIDKDFMAEESPPEYNLETFLYLDVYLGYVTCKVIFRYGDVDINALESKRTVFTRDAAGEYEVRKMIRGFGFVPSEKRDEFRLAGNDLIFDFYDKGVEKLRTVGTVFVTGEFTGKSEKKRASARFGLRLESGIMKIKVDTEGYSKAELNDVLFSFNLKKRFHRLKDGTFLTFENDESLAAASELLSGLGVTDRDLVKNEIVVPQYRALYAEKVFSKNGKLLNNLIDTDDSFQNLAKSFRREMVYELPESLKEIMRPYQKDGYNWLRVLHEYGFGGILADDMGLGKTLQVISVILADKLENPQNDNSTEAAVSSLVAAPTSLIYNWEKEFARFAPQVNVITIAGHALKRKESISNLTPDVYITTYDMLKRDIEHYTKINFRFIIADEAQNLKNPATQTAKAIKSLKGETKLALTGTPIENSLSELWSIFDFVLPGFLFDAAKFSKHYESPILKNDDKTMAAELRRQIAPFILRRIKKDVLKDLPEKIETTHYAEMPDEQRKIYTAYLAKMQGRLEETINKGKYKESQIEILSMLTRLRQICCHPATFDASYTGESGKLNLTKELVESYVEIGHRVLIFSQFTTMLNIIRAELDALKIDYFYLDGATPPKDRLSFADRFNEGECSVFLISLKAGGTGLNLTGADVVIHYDPWWNPAVMDQASDRAHRIGQKNTVHVVNIVAKDSVEEKILTLQARKKDLVDMVITEGTSFINKMSEEDILELFKD